MKMIVISVAFISMIFFSATAEAAKMHCWTTGEAWIVNETANGVTYTPAGYCAGGPWVVNLNIVVASGGTPPSWTNDRYLTLARDALTRLPNRPLRWRRASAAQIEAARCAVQRGDLTIPMDQLAPQVARSLGRTMHLR
jgi:hypothetical protein